MVLIHTRVMEFLNDDLDILDIIENGIPRRVYERANYFNNFDHMTFFQRFRLTKETVLHVLDQIQHLLDFEVDR